MPFWLLCMSATSHARYAAILIDAENGSVLHEVEATQPWYPASLTKVMTLYMTFEALNTGQLHLYDTLTASSHVSRQPNSKLGLRTGESLTVEEAILAVITRSANDAAVALGERLGGTEDNFAIKMTAKARALGMYNTRFMNATGLPNDWQITTSRDMAILAWKIKRDFPNYYPYFSSHSFYYKGRELRGINKFTARYPGAEGMKTGFTCGSGFNLIGAAHQNGKNLIGVILGGMTSAERYQLMMDMMDNGFGGAYNANTGKDINTMAASSGGEPPYQLGCGKRGGKNAASYYGGDNHTPISKRKLRGKGKHYRKSSVVAKGKRTRSNKHASLSKSTGRTKLASKNTRGAKTVSKRKAVITRKTASSKKPVAKAKPVPVKSAAKATNGKSKRYRHSAVKP